MKKITFPDGSIKSPSKLETLEQLELYDWLPADEMGLDNDMERYAYHRNVYRAAEAYGPIMIAMLMDAGVLQSEEDPTDALKWLLKVAGL